MVVTLCLIWCTSMLVPKLNNTHPIASGIVQILWFINYYSHLYSLWRHKILNKNLNIPETGEYILFFIIFKGQNVFFTSMRHFKKFNFQWSLHYPPCMNSYDLYEFTVYSLLQILVFYFLRFVLSITCAACETYFYRYVIVVMTTSSFYHRVPLSLPLPMQPPLPLLVLLHMPLS